MWYVLMGRCFTIKPLFCDITKSFFLYRKIDFFFITKYAFVTSQNKPDFYDIKKSIL